MKQYTMTQINDAMERLLGCNYQEETKVLEADVIMYSTNDDNFKMCVRKSDGMFFGYEVGDDKWSAPIGAIQSIKGM